MFVRWQVRYVGSDTIQAMHHNPAYETYLRLSFLSAAKAAIYVEDGLEVFIILSATGHSNFMRD